MSLFRIPKSLFSVTCLLVFVFITFSCARKESVWLEEMDMESMVSGWRVPQVNKSVRGTELLVAGTNYSRGIGTHAQSSFLINLNKKAKLFTAKVGVDDGGNENSSVIFYVIGDRKILWESGIMKKGDPAKEVSVKLNGIRKMGLLVTDAGDGKNNDHADWLEASVVYAGTMPEAAVKTAEITDADILTPPPTEEPHLNGPKIYGVRPGSPFLYRIPATGERPMQFSATNLPSGLALNESTGIITGKVVSKGRYPAILRAKNIKGEDQRDFMIVVGDTLALTPPMGWNSWYIHYDRVSDSLMRLSANAMISSEMANYGYHYVNIDDCWMVKANSDDSILGGAMRDENGKLLTNKRFPDMKAMTDYIHSLGLKAGTYISPGPTTCAGYAGSFEHELQDAETFSEWGFDLLKYDWCSYGRIVKPQNEDDFKAPYKKMWDNLQKLDRDIVFNLCQYGMGDVWKWGGEVGHCWRTTGDLGLESGGGMPGFFQIGMSNALHWEYARPGAWNDPDYILIGWVGSAHRMGEGVKTKLTADEQYFYMSMWSLMAAPLIFSGDMDKLDDFTLNVLCNSEVIDINQDVLGKQARILRNANNELLMVKDLDDGSKAVGLFHITGNNSQPADYFDWDDVKNPVKIGFSASEIGLSGKLTIRDVWRQEDVGEITGSYETDVPYHGVKLFRVSELK